MDKKLDAIVAIKVLEQQRSSAELTSEALCQKVVDAKIAYEAALEDYSAVIAKIEGFNKEIKSHGKA